MRLSLLNMTLLSNSSAEQKENKNLNAVNFNIHNSVAGWIETIGKALGQILMST